MRILRIVEVDALFGSLPERGMSSDERAVLNARIDAEVAEAVRTVGFGEVLTARGVTTVAPAE